MIVLTPLQVARFWAKVDTSAGADGCWPWLGAVPKERGGYGLFSVYVGPGRTKGHRAHRVAYSLVVGPIGDGMFVCHRCDNPPCCNPAHLFQGTPVDNMQDKVRKGRARGSSRVWDLEEVALLRASGLTQQAIADRIGCSQPQVGILLKSLHPEEEPCRT